MLRQQPEEWPSVQELLSLPNLQIWVKERKVKEYAQMLKRKEEELRKKEASLVEFEADLIKRKKELDKEEKWIKEMSKWVQTFDESPKQKKRAKTNRFDSKVTSSNISVFDSIKQEIQDLTNQVKNDNSL